MTWEPEFEELKYRHRLADQMGGADGVAFQHSQGKLTIRERIELLADPGSFEQMGKLQGHATYDEDRRLVDFKPSSSIKGLARIDGRPVFVSGQDFTIRGGSAGSRGGGVEWDMGIRGRWNCGFRP
jgi:acetyl-CoA carboxylase carboxyltransferase component